MVCLNPTGQIESGIAIAIAIAIAKRGAIAIEDQIVYMAYMFRMTLKDVNEIRCSLGREDCSLAIDVGYGHLMKAGAYAGKVANFFRGLRLAVPRRPARLVQRKGHARGSNM